MTNRLGVLFLLVGTVAASPAFAGDSATMKCNATQDRIWVYDSLNSFDVSAKLKCGETVEITGRVKGYVKIRAANGTQGYVPDTTFPDLPPYVDPNDAQAGAPIAKRVAPRAATAVAPAPSMASNISAPPPAAAPAPAPAAVTVVASAAPAPAPAPVPAPAVRTVAETTPAPVAVTSISIDAAPSTPAVAASAKSAPAPSPSRKSTPAAAPASKPLPPAPAAPAATSHAPALTSTSATSSTRSSSPAPSKMANTKSAAAPPQPSGAHPAPTPSVPTPAVPTPAKPVETAVTVQPQPAREVASVHTVAATESDEYPDYQPENASADPACRLFFSAYGISPAQAKWIAQNRKKQFSSICPAPNVSSVDYVIIFTHDVDFFGSTLPTPVHTDHNGFSDFSPLTMIDTALVPMSEADKSRREYVWVFKMQRGNFEPGKFSPRKRPQFTKTESHAPTRTVEEAFRFIESGGPSQ
jgi:hypothetical protein